MNRLLSIILSVAMLLPLPAWGAASLMPPPVPQFNNNSGNPCTGCKLYFYVTGTTTPKDTYTDSGAGTANANPLTLNSRGEAATGIFMNGTYTVILKTSAGSTIWSRDGITGVSDASLTATLDRWTSSGLTPTYVSGTSFTTVGDNTAMLVAGRRVKIVVSAGTYYGRISSSTFGSLTTTVVSLDSGALDTGISSVSVSVEFPTNTALALDSITTGTTAGTMKWTGTQNVTGAMTISGTINSSASNTLSGTQTVTGGIVSSGANTFTGAQSFATGTVTVSSNVVMSGTTSGTRTESGTITHSGADTFTTAPTFSAGLSSTGTITTTGIIASTATATSTFTGPVVFSNATGTITANIITATTNTTPATVNVRTKILAIGDWNMDSTDSISIAHGLDASKIRSVTVVINNDTSDGIYVLNGTVGILSSTCQGGILSTLTNVTLVRTGSGFFDSINFDNTSFNRGWITIIYIE